MPTEGVTNAGRRGRCGTAAQCRRRPGENFRSPRQAIPTRREQNLLMATWNLRAFAGLTQKWHAGPKDSPKRDWHAVACIAEIVSRFDLVAVQEIRRNTAAARSCWPGSARTGGSSSPT